MDSIECMGTETRGRVLGIERCIRVLNDSDTDHTLRTL